MPTSIFSHRGKLLSLLLILPFLWAACEREGFKNDWSLSSKKIDGSESLIQKHDDKYSENNPPFEKRDTGSSSVWSLTQRRHSFKGEKHLRTFTIELPDLAHGTTVKYSDEELLDSIDCYIEQKPYPSGKEGYFRVMEGYVKITGNGNGHELKYDISFGINEDRNMQYDDDW